MSKILDSRWLPILVFLVAFSVGAIVTAILIGDVDDKETEKCTKVCCILPAIENENEFPVLDVEALPDLITPKEVIELKTKKAQKQKEFVPLIVYGEINWSSSTTEWIYEEDHVHYLRKIIFEFADDGKHGSANRKIHIHFNKPTLYYDYNKGEKYVQYGDPREILLTHRIGVGVYRGTLIGAPVKQD